MPSKEPKKKPAKADPPKKSEPQKAPTYKDFYERFLPAAMALRPEEVEPCRADARVALANLKLGVKAVLGEKAQIDKVSAHLPKLPLDEILELPDLGRALLFAGRKVVARAASPGEIDEKIKAISKPREDMLTQAEILARRGKLPGDRIAKIRSGSGKYDMAQDGVDLADVYTENRDAIQGQHPFTEEEIESLRDNSEWLLEHLTPEGARTGPKKKSPAEDVRDRLWTLILRRFPHLRKIGYYEYGDDLDTYVPRLQSRVMPGALEEETTEDVAPTEAPSEKPS